MYGLPDKDLAKIQRVQNTAARLVSCLPRSHHITPVLMKLHWLPVKFRTIYKINLLTFKAQTCQSPAYLSELVHHYSPTRTLRSSQQSLLTTTTRASSIFYGQRSFSYAALFLWNSLPVHIRQASSLHCFKSLLKTHFKYCMQDALHYLLLIESIDADTSRLNCFFFFILPVSFKCSPAWHQIQ